MSRVIQSLCHWIWPPCCGVSSLCWTLLVSIGNGCNMLWWRMPKMDINILVLLLLVSPPTHGTLSLCFFLALTSLEKSSQNEVTSYSVRLFWRISLKYCCCWECHCVLRTKHSVRYSSLKVLCTLKEPCGLYAETPLSYRPALPFVDLDRVIVDGDWPNNFTGRIWQYVDYALPLLCLRRVLWNVRLRPRYWQMLADHTCTGKEYAKNSISWPIRQS